MSCTGLCYQLDPLRPSGSGDCDRTWPVHRAGFAALLRPSLVLSRPFTHCCGHCPCVSEPCVARTTRMLPLHGRPYLLHSHCLESRSCSYTVFGFVGWLTPAVDSCPRQTSPRLPSRRCLQFSPLRIGIPPGSSSPCANGALPF